MNRLYYGDNLEVLRDYIADESVDLVYLDPPFNSEASYNVLFEEHSAPGESAQIHAFEDTWRWDQAAADTYRETVEAGGDVARALVALHGLIPQSDMLAYLVMMAPRLAELERVMKNTATIYLHCDPKASHYLKILLDAVFGPQNFGNEIIWAYKYGGRSKKHFGRKHDVIFRYTKSSNFVFNSDNPSVRVPHEEASIDQNYRYTDEDGRRYREGTWKSGKKYRYYADEGRLRDDVITDINSLHQADAERLGYPTQKPVALLELIVQASSNPGDVVLDPFCGCGTAVVAAQTLDRQWIGIDVTHIAIGLIKKRLSDAFGKQVESTFQVKGEPRDASGAAQLAEDDKFQFQAWALGLIGARQAVGKSAKRGADGGVDGRLYFHDGANSDSTKQIVISVKGGKLKPDDVRALEAVRSRENAEIGVLISMQRPTKGMRGDAASAGHYSSPWGEHPRIQLLTVEELMDGKGINYPTPQANVTVKKAPKATQVEGEQLSIGE